MPFDFPNTPAVGDLYQVGGIAYKWDGVVWDRTATGAAATLVPEAPTDGQAYNRQGAPPGWVVDQDALKADITYVDTQDALKADITYVDAQDATLQADVNTRVKKAGDTMTGALVLPGNPTTALQATTKQYVDAAIAASALYQGVWSVAANSPDLTPAVMNPLSGWSWIAQTIDPLTPETAPPGLPGISGATIDSGDRVVWDGTGAIYNLIKGSSLSINEARAEFVDTAGDTMTGSLILNADPTVALQAATKQYVDADDALRVLRAGDTMTGALTFNGTNIGITFTGGSGIYSWTDKALRLREGTNGSQPQIMDNNGTNVRDIIDTVNGDARYINTTGDTLTGFLTLNANPTAALHAAPKQYVDSQAALKVAKAGDTMTGPLVLPADPTTALQAAPKQYVDGLIVGRVAKGGDTMSGALTLPGDPTTALQAAPKQYVDFAVATAALYQGVWNVAPNTPDLTPAVANPLNGYSWIAQTADPAVPETAPAGLPGIGGQSIEAAETIRWNNVTSLYERIRGGGLTLASATAAFVNKTGDTMSGALTIGPHTAGFSGALVFDRTTVVNNPNAIVGQTGAKSRWSMYLGSNAAESGSNVGSDFALYRFNDAGVVVNTPALNINRATGYTNIAGVLETPKLVATAGGPSTGGTPVIRMGYAQQAGGTFGHEIRTTHHGSNEGLNQMQFWLHKTTDGTTGTDAPTNQVLNLTGNALYANQTVVLAVNAGLDFTDTVAPSTIDCSKHLCLYGTPDGSGGGVFGFNITSGRMNYHVPQAVHSHVFCHGAADTLTILGTAITSLAPVVLPADPTTALQAATKQYVDNAAGAGGFVSKAGDTMTGQLLLASGANLGFGVGDNWHGWEYNSTYNGEVLKSYQGKFGFHKSAGVAPGTEIARLDDGALTLYGNRHFILSTDGYGVGFNGGGYIYKRSGGGITIREHSGGTQPQIENNDGSNRRDIIDTINGDARYVNQASVYGGMLQGPYGPAKNSNGITINGMVAGWYFMIWNLSWQPNSATWWTTGITMDGNNLYSFQCNSGSGRSNMPTVVQRVNIPAGNHTFRPNPMNSACNTDGYDFMSLMFIPTV